MRDVQLDDELLVALLLASDVSGVERVKEDELSSGHSLSNMDFSFGEIMGPDTEGEERGFHENRAGV